MRQQGFSSIPNSLLPSEIEAWGRGRGLPLRSFEFETLLALDRAYVMHHAIKQQTTRPTGKQVLDTVDSWSKPPQTKKTRTKKKS